MSELSEIHEDIAHCTKCELSKYRTRAVPGEGAANADIMFIGEAPGWHEDQQGRPFVGPAGQFLEQLLASIGLRRNQVFIANVIKCRPPGNRDPLPDEILACRHWLEQQIELIKPKIIDAAMAALAVTKTRCRLKNFLTRYIVLGGPAETGALLR